MSILSHPMLGRRFVTFLQDKDIDIPQHRSGLIHCCLVLTPFKREAIHQALALILHGCTLNLSTTSRHPQSASYNSQQDGVIDVARSL